MKILDAMAALSNGLGASVVRACLAWLSALPICLASIGVIAGENYMPANGYVPDASTAIAIAEAVSTPIYGRAQVEAEQPYEATVNDGIWTVSGHMDTGRLGGVVTIEIEQKTGRIIRVSHGR